MPATLNDNKPSASLIRRMSLMLIAVCCVVYFNTLQNGYVLDDATVITQNSMVQKGFAGIPGILTSPRLKGYTSSADDESYRPVPMLTHAVEYQLWAGNPLPSHLVNVLLFAACVLGLFRFARSLAGDGHVTIAFIAALLFATHPLHTEVVANIKSRDELLSFLFGFIALNGMVSYTRSGSAKPLIAGALALLAALLSKETTLGIVLFAPLLLWPLTVASRKRYWPALAALAAACVIFFAARFAIIWHTQPAAITFLSNPLVAASGAERLATGFLVLGRYLLLLFVPYPLVCDYSYHSIATAGLGNPLALLSIATYTCLVVLAVVRLKKNTRDMAAWGIALLLCGIVLFSNIPFLIFSEMAERFTFLASAGWCMAIAAALYGLMARGKTVIDTALNKRITIAATVIAVIFGGITLARNTDWKDNATLIATDLPKAPHNCNLNYYMAGELMQQEQQAARPETEAGSLSYLRKALEIYPGFERAHAMMGTIYDRLAIPDSAIPHDLKAIALQPGNNIATYNLARAYYMQRNYPEAIRYFKKSAELQPDVLLTYINLARCLTDNHEYAAAMIYYSKAAQLEPGNQMVTQGIAYTHAMQARNDTTRAQ